MTPQTLTITLVGLLLAAICWLVYRGFVLRRERALVFHPSGIQAYEEHGVTGRSCDTALLRLAKAGRALVVTVTRDELWVRPRFPLLSVGAALGLVHRVPLRRIHLMERLVGPRANVRFEYASEDGWCHCVELRLQNPSTFIAAVREGQLEEIS